MFGVSCGRLLVLGRVSACMSVERRLLESIAFGREHIVRMPWKTASGLVRGPRRGVSFCAGVGERTYLRFRDSWGRVTAGK